MAHELVLSALVALAVSNAPPTRLDVKPGLWEVRSTTATKMQGGLPGIDPSKLSAAQRARLQAMAERLASGAPHTTVRQSCVTQEDIDKGRGFEDDKTSTCQREYLDRSPRHVRFRIKCDEGRSTNDGEFEVTVKNPDLVVAQGTLNMRSEKNEAASKMDMTAKRLGASCGDLKPGETRSISK